MVHVRARWQLELSALRLSVRHRDLTCDRLLAGDLDCTHLCMDLEGGSVGGEALCFAELVQVCTVVGVRACVVQDSIEFDSDSESGSADGSGGCSGHGCGHGSAEGVRAEGSCRRYVDFG